MADAPKATSLTLPKKAVSVTLMIFCATNVSMIGYEIFKMLLVEFTKFSVCSFNAADKRDESGSCLTKIRIKGRNNKYCHKIKKCE